MKQYLRNFYILFPVFVFLFYGFYFAPLSRWYGISSIHSIYPSLFYWIVIISSLLLLSFFFMALKLKKNHNSTSSFFVFLFFPILLEVTIAAYLSFLSLERVALIYSLLLLNSWLLFFYLSSIHKYIFRAEPKNSLVNIMSFGGFILIYFLSSAIYGLRSILNIPIAYLMLFLFVAFVLTMYQVFWVNEIGFGSAIFYILIISLVLLELAWSISFLPFSHNILGLLISLNFYMMVGLSKHSILGSLDKKTVKLYLGFGFLSILAVLLSVKF